MEVWSGLWLQLCGLDHHRYEEHLAATLKPFPFLELKLTYFTASYTCNQHIKLSPPAPLLFDSDSPSLFLPLCLPVTLSPHFPLSSLSVCLLQQFGHRHTIHGRYMLASLQLSGEGRKGSLAWDLASLPDPRVPVCVCVWGGGWEGVAESKGGSKLNVLQRTGGPNGPIFPFFLNQTHFTSLLPPFNAPQLYLAPHPVPKLPPFSVLAHRHRLSRHQHPLRGLAVSRKRKS